MTKMRKKMSGNSLRSQEKMIRLTLIREMARIRIALKVIKYTIKATCKQSNKVSSRP